VALELRSAFRIILLLAAALLAPSLLVVTFWLGAAILGPGVLVVFIPLLMTIYLLFGIWIFRRRNVQKTMRRE
jgi:hypothetical protein